jgi:hypothetical protein
VVQALGLTSTEHLSIFGSQLVPSVTAPPANMFPSKKLAEMARVCGVKRPESITANFLRTPVLVLLKGSLHYTEGGPAAVDESRRMKWQRRVYLSWTLMLC